jgi:hypothetical protein
MFDSWIRHLHSLEFAPVQFQHRNERQPEFSPDEKMLATDSRDGNSAAQSSLMLIVIFFREKCGGKSCSIFSGSPDF